MSLQVEAAPQRRNSAQPWPTSRWALLLGALTFLTLLVHGYHPLAEDGGMYVAGIEYLLHRGLFPHLTEFVTQHLRFSTFAPLVASTVRATHLPLSVVLFTIYLVSIALTLTACRALLRRAGASDAGQLMGTALLAALWTLPVAGTSLMLMDPYVTARSLSTPLSLWAVIFALETWPVWAESPVTQHSHEFRSFAGCALVLLVGAALHPLMAGYALGLVIVVRLLQKPAQPIALISLALLVVILAAILQWHAPTESGAVATASFTRYYWFLSQWHWYEIFGLAGPLLVLNALQRWHRGLQESGRTLCLACILYGCFAAGLTAIFAHESYRAHIVASLQPLRVFLLIYLIMLPLLGAGMQRMAQRWVARSGRGIRYAVATILTFVTAGTAFGMFQVQRGEFPASIHLELPGRVNPNPWVQAFVWARENTPEDALFAIDARYITTHGEDAQSFRAIAERSILPDYSKDGGEAADTPALADEWVQGATAQAGLYKEGASRRLWELKALGVGWVVLSPGIATGLSCPYRNSTVEVCQLTP